MKTITKIMLLILLAATTMYSGEKKVLVEIFTNSHCPLCPRLIKLLLIIPIPKMEIK